MPLNRVTWNAFFLSCPVSCKFYEQRESSSIGFKTHVLLKFTVEGIYSLQRLYYFQGTRRVRFNIMKGVNCLRTILLWGRWCPRHTSDSQGHVTDISGKIAYTDQFRLIYFKWNMKQRFIKARCMIPRLISCIRVGWRNFKITESRPPQDSKPPPQDPETFSLPMNQIHYRLVTRNSRKITVIPDQSTVSSGKITDITGQITVISGSRAFKVRLRSL